MQKNKRKNLRFSPWSIFANVLVIFFLFIVIVLFALNFITQRLGIGNAVDFLFNQVQKKRVYEVEDFGHLNGEIVEDPDYSLGQVIEIKPEDYRTEEENYMNIGPRVFLFPGDYILIYDLSLCCADDDRPVAIIDVFSTNSGVEAEKTLWPSDFNGRSYQKIGFDFKALQGILFEYRIKYLGNGNLKAGNVLVERKNIDFRVLCRRSIGLAERILRSFF